MLTLSILRSPDGVAPETRQVMGGEFTIGRDPRNDWVLPDPDRFLSKRHCLLSLRAGGWQILDSSTNGCYLNHEIEPIGAKPRGLRDGDRILLGSYEIEVSLRQGEVPLLAASGLGEGAPADAAAYPEDRLPGDPFAPLLPDPLALTVGPAVALVDHYNPLASLSDEITADPVIADDGFLDAAYRPPSSSADLLPQDWDAEDPPPAAPQPATPERPAPVPPAAEGITAAEAAMAAFLRGAGLDPQSAGLLVNGPSETLEELGAAFRAMVHGLRRIMIARASIKGEFRIEQTMIRPSGNNPLKFAANDEDALAAMLNIGRRSDVAAEAAVAEALLDTRLHEVAMMTAMRDAVRDLLAQYDPDRLMAAAGGRGGLPALRRARAWSSFETHHHQILAALSDDFDSVFGKAFARAYERSMAEAQDSHQSNQMTKEDRRD
ncbi:type VI secretion system-associated FHA domain protein TagH [Acidisoma sp. C75]